jgi:regulator of RNase E activity RraA
MVEFGKPVSVGGLTIRPGDLVHADQHGVHTIPIEIASKIPEEAARIFEREHRTIDFCHSSEFSLAKLKELVRG